MGLSFRSWCVVVHSGGQVLKPLLRTIRGWSRSCIDALVDSACIPLSMETAIVRKVTIPQRASRIINFKIADIGQLWENNEVQSLAGYQWHSLCCFYLNAREAAWKVEEDANEHQFCARRRERTGSFWERDRRRSPVSVAFDQRTWHFRGRSME